MQRPSQVLLLTKAVAVEGLSQFIYAAQHMNIEGLTRTIAEVLDANTQRLLAV